MKVNWHAVTGFLASVFGIAVTLQTNGVNVTNLAHDWPAAVAVLGALYGAQSGKAVQSSTN